MSYSKRTRSILNVVGIVLAVGIGIPGVLVTLVVVGYFLMMFNSLRGPSMDNNKIQIKESSYYYDKFSKEIYSYEWNEAMWLGGFSKLKNQDTSTFELIKNCENYAKDKNNVYDGGEVIEGADVLSFVAVYAKDEKVPDCRFMKDTRYVYEYGEVIEGADPASFEIVVENGNFSKDANFVYLNRKHYYEADPKTFTIIPYPVRRAPDGRWFGSFDVNYCYPESEYDKDFVPIKKEPSANLPTICY